MRLEPELKHEVARVLGNREFFHCYQCGRCTAFCPVFQQTPQGFNPRKVLQRMFIGQVSVLKDPSLWRCTTCYECFEHCPFGINLGEVIVALRNLAVRRFGAPKELETLWAQVQKAGFILPETERIRTLRASLGLSPVSTNGTNDVRTLVEALQRKEKTGEVVGMVSEPSDGKEAEDHG